MNPHFITRPSCPGCSGRTTRTIFSRPYAESRLRAALEAFYAEVGHLDYEVLLGADYVLQRCEACSLVFQRDVPDDFLLGRLYEEWISPARAFERFHAHPAHGRQQEIARDVAVSFSLVRGGQRSLRTLDYGCGWGEWGRATLAFGAETWGTELSASRREKCQRDGIKVAAEGELPKGYFDLINADQVFEHLPAPAATFAFLRPLLRPSGVIRIGVPNGWRIGGKIDDFDRELKKPRLGGLNPVAPLEHLNCFTTRSLVRMAADQGLRRLMPPLGELLRKIVWAPGARTKLKEALRPFYLRSRWSTQLWFAPEKSQAA